MKPPDHPASPDQANAGSDNLARLAIEAHPEPGGVRVRPCGEIDLATVDRIRRQLDQCVAAGHKRVVLDLRDVTFMDSTGLHLILQSERGRPHGGMGTATDPRTSPYSSSPACATPCPSSKRPHPLHGLGPPRQPPDAAAAARSDLAGRGPRPPPERPIRARLTGAQLGAQTERNCEQLGAPKPL
jgi:hypothetical protein